MELFKIINQPKQKILTSMSLQKWSNFKSVLSSFSETSHATIQNPLDSLGILSSVYGSTWTLNHT